MKNILINLLTAGLSLCTTTGVFLHDTQVDHAVAVALHQSSNALSLSEEGKDIKLKVSQPHTHSDSGDGIKNMSSDGYAALPKNDRRRHSSGAFSLSNRRALLGFIAYRLGFS